MTTCDAALFDLDDTLFLQDEWLAGAWRAVAERGAALGLDGVELEQQLLRQSRAGSARGHLIDNALEEMAAPLTLVPELVAAFTAYRAPSLTPFPGAVEGIAELRRMMAVAVVTDGNPQIQRSKLASLGLSSAFDAVVVSDEYGREHRKPHQFPFRLAASLLGVEPSRIIVVGDHPEKDVAGATGAGMTVIRVRTGEYARSLNPVQPWADVADVAVAIRLIKATKEEASGPRPQGGRAHLHPLV
jgi:putative hydrolase of the HAD superfamily